MVKDMIKDMLKDMFKAKAMVNAKVMDNFKAIYESARHGLEIQC